MTDNKLEIGDLVWAKMKTYPYWPSRIVDPPVHIKIPSSKKAQHCVLFFGTNDYAWISDDLIVPHSEEMVLSSSKSSKKISSALQSAINEIIELSRNISVDGITSSMNGDNEGDEDVLPNISEEIAEIRADKEKFIDREEVAESSKKSETRESSLTLSDDASCSSESLCSAINGDDEDETTEEMIPTASQHVVRKKITKVRKKIVSGKARKRKNSTNKPDNKRKCSSQSVARMATDFSAILTPTVDYSNLAMEQRRDLETFIHGPVQVERPLQPVLDVMKISDFLKAKEIKPTDKKIGFLGLGMIGRGVVKNLLHSGHKVTVWNRNPEKCEPFVKAGACKGLTPADVVASCDIIFCCVSDSMAVKSLVFETCGVLKGFEGCTVGSPKGYVEMTSIDAATSLEVSNAIIHFGGRYLEAPVIGSRKLAEEGSLLSLVAGDRELFNDCYSCFFAFTGNVYFLSNVVGNGSKMNLIQSMLFGTISAALAEALALVDRCKLSQESFLKILGMGPLGCPLLLDKGRAMAGKNFITNTALKHQQKDLSLVLKLSNAVQQTTLTTSAANEVFKKAKFLDYADHDISAVLMGAH